MPVLKFAQATFRADGSLSNRLATEIRRRRQIDELILFRLILELPLARTHRPANVVRRCLNWMIVGFDEIFRYSRERRQLHETGHDRARAGHAVAIALLLA